MKQTVNFSMFCDAFSIRKENFTYDGLEALYNYLENLEEETGDEIDLDVIALCCEYSVDSVADIASNYSIDLSECEDDDARFDAVMSYLNDNTSVCGDYEDADTGTRHIVYCTAF